MLLLVSANRWGTTPPNSRRELGLTCCSPRRCGPRQSTFGFKMMLLQHEIYTLSLRISLGPGGNGVPGIWEMTNAAGTVIHSEQ